LLLVAKKVASNRQNMFLSVIRYFCYTHWQYFILWLIGCLTLQKWCKFFTKILQFHI